MENAKKVWYYEKWVGRHASFPPRQSVKLNETKIYSILFQTRQGRRYEMVPDQIRWYHSQQRKVNFLGTNNLYGALHIVLMKVNKRCVR